MAAAASGTNAALAKAMPMARKLAYRNLFHDRVSLLVTLVGIVFSVVLIAVQCSIYLGSEYRIVAVMDHIEADLWVVPVGTKAFDLPTAAAAGSREECRSLDAGRAKRRGSHRQLRQLAPVEPGDGQDALRHRDGDLRRHVRADRRHRHRGQQIPAVGCHRGESLRSLHAQCGGGRLHLLRGAGGRAESATARRSTIRW